MSNAGSSTGFEDDIAEHDGSAYLDDLPESMYYHVLPQTVEWRVDVNQVYGYPYPNKILICSIFIILTNQLINQRQLW